MMERGVVVVTVGLMGVATLLGGVSSGDAEVAKFLTGEAEELRGVTAGMAVVDAVQAVPTGVVAATLTVMAAVIAGEAEGTKGLASTLSVDVAACAEGPVDEAEVGGGSGMPLDGLKTEVACEAGMGASVGLDFVGAALAREGVLVIGVVVCESGVEPGGV